MPPTTEKFALHAWGDESYRDDPGRDPLYLVGAVVADPMMCDEPREQLRVIQAQAIEDLRARYAKVKTPANRRSVEKARRKLHWHDILDERKGAAVELIASFDMLHLIVVAAPVTPRKQERARRLCLEQLAWKLDETGVSHLFLESRSEGLNQKDRNLVENLRGRRCFPEGLRLEHVHPSTEPMVWVPDQVLGAVGAEERGDGQYVERIGLIDRVPIQL